MSNRAQRLRKFSPLLYRVHTYWRAWRQERQIVWEHAEYAANNGVLRSTDPLSIEVGQGRLRERLARRGLVLKGKAKGNLHIIYATRPSNWEPHNIPPELAKLGKVTVYYYANRGFNDSAPEWLEVRNRLDQDILAFVREVHDREPVDAFVGYLSGWQIAPETIQAIGEMDIVTFGFHWDDKLGFRGQLAGGRWRGPAAVASVYDLNLTNAPDSIPKYAAEGGLAILWPEAANPEHFRPLDFPLDYDVSFIGGCYGYRPILIEYLRRHGIWVDAFGPGWPNGAIHESKMIEVYARSRINLGFGGIGYSMKAQCLKGRDFEVPMCGALYLTSENPDLHLVYDINREILTYTTREDCLAKICYFLDHPEEEAAIRRAARERCLQDHTWEKRFVKIFKMAGLLTEQTT